MARLVLIFFTVALYSGLVCCDIFPDSIECEFIDSIPGSIKFIRQDINIDVLCTGAIKDYDIREISLSGNNLRYVQRDAFPYTNLIEHISIINNKLNIVVDGVFNSKALRSVSLKMNRIADVRPWAFYDLPNLKVVNLSDNKLKQLNKDAFLKVPSLETLLVKNNLLKNVGEQDISSMTNLKLLDLRKNRICTIHGGTFRDLRNLEKLDLSYNRISLWDERTFSVSGWQIREISLAFNQIMFFPKNSFDNLSDTLVKIIGNPIKCTCYDRISQKVKLRRTKVPQGVDFPVCVGFAKDIEGCREDINYDDLFHFFRKTQRDYNIC